NAEDVPRGQPHGDLRRQSLTVEQIRSRLAILSARSTGRPVPPAFGEQCRLHRGERLEFADDAVAPPPLPRAAAASAQRVGAHAQGVLHLQYLDRRVQRVRHTDMDARRTIGTATRTLPATNRFVVGPGSWLPTPDPAESHVVHRTLALRRHDTATGRERAKHRVGDALRRLDISGRDRAGWPRIDETS